MQSHDYAAGESHLVVALGQAPIVSRIPEAFGLGIDMGDDWLVRRLTIPPLVWLWIALVVGGAALAAIARTSLLLPMDQLLTRELQERRGIASVLLPLMIAVSWPGDYPWAETLTALAVAISLIPGRRRTALFIALTATAGILTTTVKVLVARERPSTDVVQVYRTVSGYSFPSGHVIHYVVLFGALGYLTIQALGRTPARQRWRRLALSGLVGICAVLILLVGASRVYLGAHWSSDVLGGYLLGSAWLLLLIAIRRRWLIGPGSSSVSDG